MSKRGIVAIDYGGGFRELVQRASAFQAMLVAREGEITLTEEQALDLEDLLDHMLLIAVDLSDKETVKRLRKNIRAALKTGD